MSHPNLDPAPPTANTRGRLRWLTDNIRRDPTRYSDNALTGLRADALDLALAAGLGDEHRLLAELTAARAAGDHARVSKLAGELSARVASWGIAASEAMWRADRDAALGSERGQR